MNKNPTHTTVMARTIAAQTDLSYLQAKALIETARTKGQLPAVLDKAAMAQVVELLVAQVRSGIHSDADSAPAVSIPSPAHNAKVLAIVSPKGGTGVTTLAINLAERLAQQVSLQGQRVCLIDAALPYGDVGKYLNYYTPCITDLVTTERASRQFTKSTELEPYLVQPPQSKISALLAPAQVRDTDPTYINGTLYTRLLRILRSRYDYIVIDTPVADKYHELYNDFVLPESDFILTVANPNYTTLIDIDRWLRDVTRAKSSGGGGVEVDIVGFVLNKAKIGINCSEKDVRRELASWSYLGSLPFSEAWERSSNDFTVQTDLYGAELDAILAAAFPPSTGQ